MSNAREARPSPSSSSIASRHAIEAGELEPGEKLPPTRELAAEVGINHLTAARVYRRLAELGYVTASVGRGTFVRALAPAASAEGGDDWQIYALPEREVTYPEQVLADGFTLAGEPGMLSLATGWPAPSMYPAAELGRIAAEVFETEGGGALSYLPAEGLYDLREQLALRGREHGFAADADEIVVTSGAQQAISLAARAVLEPGRTMAVESPTFAGLLHSAARHRRARARRPRRRARARRRRARAPARPPRGVARRAADRLPEPDRAPASPRSAASGSPSSRSSATSSSSRTASTRTSASRASRCARCAS